MLDKPNAVAAAVALSALAVTSHRAAGVLLVDHEARNVDAPTGSLASAWNLQGSYYGFNATPISRDTFISAKHIGAHADAQISIFGSSYQATSYADIAGTDLRVFKIDTLGGTHTFSSYATLYDAAVDGIEDGKPLAVFGRGTARGEAIYAPLPTGPGVAPVKRSVAMTLTSAGSNDPAPQQSGNLRGWAWGPNDGLESWGRNIVDGTVDDDTYGELLTYSFSNGPDAVDDEAGLSGGDSGGGLFIFSGGQWKLAGINLGVDGAWSYSEPGPYFNASLFDARGFYAGVPSKSELIADDGQPVEASSYSSRIGGADLAEIRALVSGTSSTGGGLSVLPEPGFTTLGFVTMTFARRVARRKQK